MLSGSSPTADTPPRGRSHYEKCSRTSRSLSRQPRLAAVGRLALEVGELVARAAHGLDVEGILGIGLYLLADVLDVDVGRPRLAEELPVPEVAHDLLAAVDSPWAGG